MSRRGEFFDQDAGGDESADNPWGPPAHANRGMLYDQDASMELPRLDPLQVERYQRELERRRAEERRNRQAGVQGRGSGARPAGDGNTEPAAAPVSASRPAPPAPSTPPVRITSRAAPPYPPVEAPAPPPAASPASQPAAPPRPLQPPPAAGPPSRPASARAETQGPPARRESRAQPRPQPEQPRSRPEQSEPPDAAESRPSSPSMRRTTSILAAGTFTSRLTGFLRVLVIGYVLGVGVLSDAFNYANGVPNIIYDLLLGGILSATLIPVFVEQLHEDDPEESSRSISAILTTICVALVVVSAALYFAAPLVIRFYLLMTPGATGGPEKGLATRLLRDFSPQVFFLGATVASTALLNARRRFTAAAVSPVINNVIAIAALLATKVVADHVLTQKGLSDQDLLNQFSRDGRAVLILGVGTTIGYVVQLLVQLPSMRRLGVRIRPVWHPRHPAVRRVAGLSSWLMGVVVANQVALALVMILAGRTQGGVTAYQFGYQFFQLPYALIAVSVASAIMPDLSERWAARQRVDFERQFVTGLRVSLAVLIPVALVYMAVAQPFIQLAIHHGAVGASGAHLVTRTLVLFLAGLPGFSAFFLLMRAFQAMQDARTMFRVYVVENVMTLIAAPVLVAVMGIPGLALAWAGPYTAASIYAVVLLRRRVGNLGGWLTIRALFRIVLASAISGAVAVALGLLFPGGQGDPLLLLRLVVQAGAAAGVYVYMAHVLHIRELRPLLAVAGRFTGRR